jgi:stage V sporulation protein AE
MEYFKAFITGGAICIIGQLLIDFTKLTPARILTGFVVGGLVLTAIGVYQPIVDFGGAGARIPISGFGYSLAKGVEKAVESGEGIIGALSGGMVATAAGISAAILFGLVISVIFKSGDKS